jgi:hypothetical protein
MKDSERIATMVHAFDDAGRKDEVRRLAERVKRLEAVAKAAERIAGPKLPSAGDWDMLRLSLAALDSKGT